MRLGISTACFYPQPLEETIDRIASLGFSVMMPSIPKVNMIRLFWIR